MLKLIFGTCKALTQPFDHFMLSLLHLLLCRLGRDVVMICIYQRLVDYKQELADIMAATISEILFS